MLRLGWTRQELDSADPEDVARLIWLLDAERVAKIAERLDEAAAIPLPEMSGSSERAKAMLDRASVLDSLEAIDVYLMGSDEDDGAH